MKINDERAFNGISLFSRISPGEVFSSEKVPYAMKLKTVDLLVEFNAVDLQTGSKLQYDGKTSVQLLNAELSLDD